MELAEQLYVMHIDIQTKSNELKSLKKSYDELTETLKEHMIHEKMTKIQLQNKKVLHLKEKKTFSALNKDYILETLKSFYKQPVAQHKKPDELAEKTTDTIIDNREAKLSWVLKFLNK